MGLDNELNYLQGKGKSGTGIKDGMKETHFGYSEVSNSNEVESAQRKSVIPRIVTCLARFGSSGVRSESEVDKGLAFVGPLLLGLLSFDEACSKSKQLKPKVKKAIEVKSLGKIVEGYEAQQTYFACLNPKFAPKFLNKNLNMEKKANGDDNFSGGTIICCDSMTDSDIAQCNMRLNIDKESMVAKNVKDSIIRMGIIGGNSEEVYRRKLKEWS